LRAWYPSIPSGPGDEVHGSEDAASDLLPQGRLVLVDLSVVGLKDTLEVYSGGEPDLLRVLIRDEVTVVVQPLLCLRLSVFIF